MTRVLGAVLAGGQSRRFGSDKAAALLYGRPLLDWASSAITDWVDEIVICGRDGGLPDRPAPGMGPLGGLSAALRYGQIRRFAAVLTIPCDAPVIPSDAIERLLACGAPSYVAECPVIGIWPCADARDLDAHLAAGHLSMRSWTAVIGARPVVVEGRIANINTRDDLAKLGRRDE